jgi:putative flippase GtrA
VLQFILYCFCGGLGVSSDFLIYYYSLALGVGYQLSNFLGYFSGTLVSFILNRKITFNSKDKIYQRMGVFLAVASFGYVVSAILLFVMIKYMYFDPKIAKLITLPFVVIIQFTINKCVTFKK